MNNLERLYQNTYFKQRENNDTYRQLSFEQEKTFIEKHTKLDGDILDVGCSTGEFLKYINWKGKRYGIEISKFGAEQAKKNNINIVNDYNNINSLDVVIYRGTIQHLDSPFKSIHKASESLKPDGKMFFLATPNINCIYYRLFKTLPALDPERNFYLPSDRSLKEITKIFDLKLLDVQYPYIGSPYAKPMIDHFKFLYKLFNMPWSTLNKKINFSFYRNMMNIVFVKNK